MTSHLSRRGNHFIHILAGLAISATLAAAPARAQESKTTILDSLTIPDLKPAQVTDFVTVVEPDSQIFPSLIIAQATLKHTIEELLTTTDNELGDTQGLIGVGLVNPAPNTPITVTISCDELMHPVTMTTTLANQGEVYSIAPKIRWKYSELLHRRQQMPIDVVFRVKVGDEIEQQSIKTCVVRDIHDCPHAMLIGDQVEDAKWMFAAYVNEDHPWVDTILKEAIATGVVKQFVGYQANDPQEVYKQVYAIWRALQTRGITYSSISIVSAEADRVASQHVRFLDESIENKQANCIDGTVMLASILRKIGINPRIVVVPGHAYLAFDLNPEGTEMAGLETTIMGQARSEDFPKLGKLQDLLINVKTFDKASFESFEAALRIGSDNLAAALPKIYPPEPEAAPETTAPEATAEETKPEESKPEESQPAQTEEPPAPKLPEYWLISIAEARAAGIRPIPFVKDNLPAAPAPVTPATAEPAKPTLHLIPPK